MTKPDDIPQDVWDAAVAVGDLIPNGDGDAVTVCTGDIARAILAEREACASLARTADEYLFHDDRLEGLSNAGLDALVERDARIADAIRKRA